MPVMQDLDQDPKTSLELLRIFIFGSLVQPQVEVRISHWVCTWIQTGCPQPGDSWIWQFATRLVDFYIYNDLYAFLHSKKYESLCL